MRRSQVMAQAVLWLVLFLIPDPRALADLVIGGGVRLVVSNGSLVDLHCGDLSLQTGGTLDIGDGGHMVNCGDVTLASGAALEEGAGTLTLNGVWRNDSDFVLADSGLCRFTTACGAENGAAGASDTDGDGLTDGIEGSLGTNPLVVDTDGDRMTDGMEDANHNGVVDDDETDPSVADAGPGVPVPVVPADAATDVCLTPALEVAYGPGVDPALHAATRWQIATDAVFEHRVLESTSTDKRIELTVPTLVLETATAYYWRACYYGTDGHPRLWSAARRFTTTSEAPFTDANHNGVPDDQEPAPGVVSDMDGDGQNDCGQSDMMCVTLPDGGGLFCFKPIANVNTIEILERTDPDAIAQTQNRPINMTLGLYGFRLEVADPTMEAVVRAYCSQSVRSFDGWFKYDSINGWLDYTGYVRYGKDRRTVTINLVDGGFGDADGVANGVIVDPSGPGLVPHSWGGGGGCFIQSAGDPVSIFSPLLFE